MNILKNSFEVLLYGFIALLFLSINSDSSQLILARMILGSALIIWAFFLPDFRSSLRNVPPYPVYFFALFLVFQAAKFIWGFYHRAADKGSWPVYEKYMQGPGVWLFYFLIVMLSFYFFSRKNRVQRLLKALMISASFVAMNAIPPLLSSGQYGYKTAAKIYFFHPLFYSQQWLEKYLFGVIPNMNWPGDFLSFGVFPGLCLGFYGLYRIFEKKESVTIAEPFLCFFLSMVNAAGIFLLQSRGSMASFLAVFAGSLFFLLAKVSAVKKMALIGLAGLFFGFIAWAGNFSGAMQEMSTLSSETTLAGQNSLVVNVEGAKRALRMFHSQPVFGIGRGNYINASETFADEGVEQARAELANYSCLSHYMQQLAEEGAGIFFYFLFLALVLFYGIRKISSSPSRFQSLAGLALLAPVLMVMMHASINNLMDRFSMPCLVYLSMGALMAIFRKDFEHYN